jgi:hypothetical protein
MKGDVRCIRVHPSRKTMTRRGPRSKSEISALKRCGELLFIDESFSHSKLDRTIESQGSIEEWAIQTLTVE